MVLIVKKRTANIEDALIPFCLLFCFLLCSPLSLAENSHVQPLVQEDVELTLEEVKTLLDKQVAEWNEMKPALKRLIKSEQDLALRVSSLEQKSTPASAPGIQPLPNADIATAKPLASINSKQNKTNVKIGIHIASYKKAESLEKGWKLLLQKNSKELTGKVPFYYQVSVKGVAYTRLVAGAFQSGLSAQQACKEMKSKNHYCQVINYKIHAPK